MGTASQGQIVLWFSRPLAGAGWEIEQRGHEPEPRHNASTCRQRISPFSHHAGPFEIFSPFPPPPPPPFLPLPLPPPPPPYFCVCVSQMFTCSFLAFEVFFHDIFGLRVFAIGLFAIALNDHVIAANHFMGFFVSFTEAYPVPKFPVVTNLNEARRTGPPPNLTCMGSSQVDASTRSWAWSLRLWRLLGCHAWGRLGWGKSWAPVVKQCSHPSHLQQRGLPQPWRWVTREAESWTHQPRFLVARRRR